MYDGSGERIAGDSIRIWQTVVVCLVPAYVLTYVTAASTKIYLMLRQACDGQSESEIWRSRPGWADEPLEENEEIQADDASSE